MNDFNDARTLYAGDGGNGADPPPNPPPSAPDTPPDEGDQGEDEPDRGLSIIPDVLNSMADDLELRAEQIADMVGTLRRIAKALEK